MPVDLRQQIQGLVVQAVGPARLKLHEFDEAIGLTALEDLVGLDIKLLQLVHRQVDATAQGIFTNIPDDVGELQGQAEFVGVVCGLLLRLAENVGCHFAHHTGHQMAIALQAWIVEVTGLIQVHLATLDHGQQMALFNLEVDGQWHQRLQHRVARLTGKRLHDFGLPPRQLAAGNTRICSLVDHVIDLAAESVKSGNGRAAWRRQEQKGVVKATA